MELVKRTAKHNGTCLNPQCKAPIYKREPIVWVPGRGAFCCSCRDRYTLSELHHFVTED